MVIRVNSEKNKKSQKHGARIFDKDFSLFRKINLKKAAMALQRISPQRSLLSPFMIF